MDFKKLKNESNMDAMKRYACLHPLNVTLDYFGENYDIIMHIRNVYDERGKSTAVDFTITLEMECFLRDLYQGTMNFTLTSMIVNFISICEIREINLLTRCTCEI